VKLTDTIKFTAKCRSALILNESVGKHILGEIVYDFSVSIKFV